MKDLSIKCLILISLNLLFLGKINANENIVITKSWVRHAPDNAKTLAAYMTIENKSEQKIILIGVQSSVFNKVEIHKTENKDGTIKMKNIKQIIIDKKDKFVLAPGEFHLMLIGRKKKLALGNQVPITLNFKNGSSISTKLMIKKSLAKIP